MTHSSTPNSRPPISTIEGIIRVHGAHRPNAPMATFDGETRSYQQIDGRSNRVANGLLRLGILPHMRVALIAKNGHAFFEILFGARKVGAVQVAVNWRLSTDEMQYIVGDSQAEVLFVEAAFVGAAEAIGRALPGVRKIIQIGGEGGARSAFDTYESWLGDQSDADTTYTSLPDDVALQLYTSGTTGRPKGAMLMNQSLFGFVRAAESAFGFDPSGIHLNCLPLFHVGGINWSLQAYTQGAHVIAFREFDADVLVREVERSRVTHLMTVPAVIQLLLSRPIARTTDFSSLRVIVYGGSTISEKVLKDAIATFGHTLYGMYGSTELSFGATVLTPDEHVSVEHPEWLRSCGRPLPGSEIRVVDPTTGEEVPEGQTGEMWFRSQQVGKGYWKQPEATAEKFRVDGWYRTGDLGHQLGGYVYLSDRLNDMIISGAENIYPAEIERVLSEHPRVTEVVAFGIPDPKWGEAVHAVVVLDSGASVSEAELLRFTSERLARYKCPRSIAFAESLPKTASGKVQRQSLRAPHWVGHSRRIA